MSQLMLISNPKKRSGAKKHRTAAQRAATKRMIAANRSRGRKPRKTHPIGLARVTHSTRRAKRRHNPISMRGMGGNIGGLVMDGLKGAVGSVAVNAIVSYLPAQLNTGKAVYATRAGLAVLLGTVGRKVLGRHARTIAEGALVVNFADLINSTVGASLPGSTLHGIGGMGKYLSVYPSQPVLQPVNARRRMNEMGEYVS